MHEHVAFVCVWMFVCNNWSTCNVSEVPVLILYKKIETFVQVITDYILE